MAIDAVSPGFRSIPGRLIATLCAACACTASFARQADVTFFVIGKHANFQQDRSGELQSVDFSFFSEIFLTGDGDASGATLTFPTGERIDFADMRKAKDSSRDNILLVSGADRFTGYADLQERYPDGRYRISFDSPSGSVKEGDLRFDTRGLPSPPRIYVREDGKEIVHEVDANRDLKVSWSDFEQGRADANGILDDLIFVILTDEEGNRVAHSGRPFENRPYLTYADSGFVIDASILSPGKTYTLSVEHAMLDDTRQFGGVPAMTTRAVTSKLELSAKDR